MSASTWPETQVRRHPFKILVALLTIATTIELLQYQSEAYSAAHAGGEIVRNLAYALVGAQVFHLLGG